MAGCKVNYSRRVLGPRGGRLPETLRSFTGGGHVSSSTPAAAVVVVENAARGFPPKRLVLRRATESEEDAQVTRFRRQLDKEYMEGKIEEAVRDAVEACEDTEEMKECAIAWEAVEELRDAADRKRLGDEVTTNNGDGFMVLEGGNGAAEGQKDYPAGLQGRDFLADVAPCEAEECDAPSGSLFAAGGLERSIQRLEMEKGEEAKRKEKEEGEGNL